MSSPLGIHSSTREKMPSVLEAPVNLIETSR